jgi:hypothetical protein
LVEHVTENHGVPSSNLGLGTSLLSDVQQAPDGPTTWLGAGTLYSRCGATVLFR